MSTTLVTTLESATNFIRPIANEDALTKKEIKAAADLYAELFRILNRSTRTGKEHIVIEPPDSKLKNYKSKFHYQFVSLQQEFADASKLMNKTLYQNPATVRPLAVEALEQCDDFFVLDNTLRETTVGAHRGHTIEEKHKILKTMAGTGVKEVILGAYGNKISVDSQLAHHWHKKLGKPMDNTWGFVDAYDFESIEDEKIWSGMPDFVGNENKSNHGDEEMYVPPTIVRTTYDDNDRELLEKASKHAIRYKDKLDELLKTGESPQGRVPMGFIMMAMFGICNVVLEIDTSLATMDYDKYDPVERCEFLINWAKQHLQPRISVNKGDDDTSARVLVNIRDFTNLSESVVGFENALYLIDGLCRKKYLDKYPLTFGFMMEEPTGYLFPDEVGKMIRMMRLTMERAGHPKARFLVHVHMYFGLAEATTLACLCNGADGVWAAVCTTGAQVGHACSTTTIVNLIRAGHSNLIDQYNLKKICKAARDVTEITTHQPCPKYTEVYGELAFDIPFIMTNLPVCRGTLINVTQALGYKRQVRINEISFPSTIYHAMHEKFGSPQEGGWNPIFCNDMHVAIMEQLTTGISRDYNTPLGLGTLYKLVSKDELSIAMITKMSSACPIRDTHPTLLEFTARWNRLVKTTQWKQDVVLPGVSSDSVMFYNEEFDLLPLQNALPLRVLVKDITRTMTFIKDPILQAQMIDMVLEQKHKNENQDNNNNDDGEPIASFHELKLALKLFLMEIKCDIYPTVDDFLVTRCQYILFETLMDDTTGDMQADAPHKQAIAHVLLKAMSNEDTNKNTAMSRQMRYNVLKAVNGLSMPEPLQLRLNELRRSSGFTQKMHHQETFGNVVQVEDNNSASIISITNNKSNNVRSSSHTSVRSSERINTFNGLDGSCRGMQLMIQDILNSGDLQALMEAHDMTNNNMVDNSDDDDYDDDDDDSDSDEEKRLKRFDNEFEEAILDVTNALGTEPLSKDVINSIRQVKSGISDDDGRLDRMLLLQQVAKSVNTDLALDPKVVQQVHKDSKKKKHRGFKKLFKNIWKVIK